MNFAVVLLVALAAWTLLNFMMAVLFLIPIPCDDDNNTIHFTVDTFVGPDHSPNNTLGAAFFFAVQTLSTVGYG